MRRIALLALVALAAAVYPVMTWAGSNGSDNGTMCSLTTQLRAENETTGSTSTAHGESQIKIRNDATLEWKTHIVNNDGQEIFAGHVHQAPAGVAGSIRVPLFAASPPVTDAQLFDSGEKVIDATLAADICADPADYYVNYHSIAWPGGVVRGQLG
jgi:hypothetical protein